MSYCLGVEFRDSFNGDHQAKIDELLAMGRVTKFQINQATEVANLIKGVDEEAIFFIVFKYLV